MTNLLIHTKKKYIPSTASEQDLLPQGTLPSHFDPDKKIVHVSSVMQEQLGAVEKDLASLVLSDLP